MLEENDAFGHLRRSHAAWAAALEPSSELKASEAHESRRPASAAVGCRAVFEEQPDNLRCAGFVRDEG